MGSERLQNRYYAMRHGQSRANQQELIVSHPQHGKLDIYGLSKQGEQEVLRAATVARLSSRAIIYSSDFSRARQSAEIISDVIGADQPLLTAALRERNFGKWELSSTDHYHRVWQADASFPELVHEDGVETAREVYDRTAALLARLERYHKDEDILLVSHGDTLQIMQTGFVGLPPHHHRQVEHLRTAEIRHLR